jgi:hypothetical protein
MSDDGQALVQALLGRANWLESMDMLLPEDVGLMREAAAALADDGDHEDAIREAQQQVLREVLRLAEQIDGVAVNVVSAHLIQRKLAALTGGTEEP